MARSVGSLIEDMLIAIDDIRTFTDEMAMSDFLSSPKTDRKSYLAVVAAFIQLAEAARALPDEFKACHPQVEWKLIGGMRNLLVIFSGRCRGNLADGPSAKLTFLRDSLQAARED